MQERHGCFLCARIICKILTTKESGQCNLHVIGACALVNYLPGKTQMTTLPLD